MFALSFTKGDVSLNLLTESRKAFEFVQEVFDEPSLKVCDTSSKAEGIEITYGFDDDAQDSERAWWVHDQHSEPAINKRQLKSGDFIFHISDRLVFHCADKIGNLHCLHAAAVAKDDLAIVIPAKSGSGKSSLTCWLLANGFDYVTDELIMVGESGYFESVRRPLQIKSHGIEAVKPLLANYPKGDDGTALTSEQQGYYAGNWANAIPPSSFGAKISDHPKHKLAMFLFPKYQADVDCNFDRLKQAQAGLVLMGNNVNARNHPTHGFGELMAIVRAVPSYYLNYGGFDKLPNDFAEQLESILKGVK